MSKGMGLGRATQAALPTPDRSTMPRKSGNDIARQYANEGWRPAW